MDGKDEYPCIHVEEAEPFILIGEFFFYMYRRIEA